MYLIYCEARVRCNVVSPHLQDLRALTGWLLLTASGFLIMFYVFLWVFPIFVKCPHFLTRGSSAGWLVGGEWIRLPPLNSPLLCLLWYGEWPIFCDRCVCIVSAVMSVWLCAFSVYPVCVWFRATLAISCLLNTAVVFHHFRVEENKAAENEGGEKHGNCKMLKSILCYSKQMWPLDCRRTLLHFCWWSIQLQVRVLDCSVVQTDYVHATICFVFTCIWVHFLRGFHRCVLSILF